MNPFLKNVFQSIKHIHLPNSIKGPEEESLNPFRFRKDDAFLAGNKSFMGEVMEKGHVEKGLVPSR